METDTQSMSQAWNVWSRVWADHRVKFHSDPDDLEPEFRLPRLHGPSPKVWADAYLRAFAAVAGLQLVAPSVSVLQL